MSVLIDFSVVSALTIAFSIGVVLGLGTGYFFASAVLMRRAFKRSLDAD